MRTVLLLIFLSSALVGWAGELVLSGTYQGKDLFVRNPYSSANGNFCVQSVTVNGNTVLSDPQISALRVALGLLVAKGEQVVVRILYRDGCQPTVLNPEVLRLDRDFRFIDVTATNNSVDFSTEGEKSMGRFVIEMRFTNNDLTHFWEDQFEVTAKGNMDINRYSGEPRHYAGDNVYRIRYEPIEGKPIFSEEFTYTSTKKPISFSPVSVTTKITLSEWAEYEIHDSNGRVLKKGEAREIQLQELKPGEYYLKIQNRYEKFVKK